MVWQHREMLFRPRFGAVGMVALPFALVFEITGVLTVPVAWYLGVVDTTFLVLFLVVAVLFGVFLSVAALALEEVGPHRYPRLGQLAKLLMWAVLENVGFRQLVAIWRAWALVEAIFGKKDWGAMDRQGLGAAAVIHADGVPDADVVPDRGDLPVS